MTQPPDVEPLPAVSRKRPEPHRRLRSLLVVVPAIYVVLVLLMNVAIWSGLIERVISGQRERSTVHLSVEDGWLLWPTRVHIRQLELDIDAYNYRLRVVVPRATADIALWEVFDRAFHARKIRAEDATIILQLKPEQGKADARRLAEWPHLSGPQPPVRAPERPEPPEFRKAFRVELEDIDATLLQFWFQELRLYGPHGRLQGGVYSVTGHRFGVPEARLTIEGGTLGTASVPAALRDVSGTLHLAIAEYAVGEVRGRDVLPQIDAGAELDAQVRTLAFLQPFLPPSAPTVAGGHGKLTVDASLEHGMLTPGSRVDLQTEDVVTRLGPTRLYTHLGIEAAVERKKEGSDLRVTTQVELSGLRGFSEASKEPWVVARPVTGEASFQVSAPATWKLADYGVAAPHLEVRDLSALPVPGTKLGGTVVLNVHAERRDDRTSHRGRADFAGVEVSTKNFQAGGAGHVTFAGSFDPATKRTTVQELSASITDLDLTSPEGRSRDAWVQVSDGRLSFAPASGSLTARVQGRLSDLPSLLEHTSARPAVIALAELGISGPVSFDVEVRRDREALAVEVHELTRPMLDVRAHFVRRGAHTRYAGLLAGARLGVRGSSKDGNTTTDLKARADDAWLEQQRAWIEALASGENGS